MRYGAVNEEEFIEMQRKWIRGFYLLLGLWVIVVPIVVVYDFPLVLTMFFIAIIPVAVMFWGNRNKRKGLGLWLSTENLMKLHAKYINIFVLFLLLSIAEISILFRMKYAFNPFQFADYTFSFFFVIILVLFIPVAVRYGSKEGTRRFGRVRSLSVKLPRETVDRIILDALHNLKLDYRNAKPESKWSMEPQSYIELSSGMRISTFSNLPVSTISISRIPEGSSEEREIEKEILRLSNLHQSE